VLWLRFYAAMIAVSVVACMSLIIIMYFHYVNQHVKVELAENNTVG
jgi:sterol desaturase/sphingolipid hydroxylase (fatty acid hydroxylase superfamily)